MWCVAKWEVEPARSVHGHGRYSSLPTSASDTISSMPTALVFIPHPDDESYSFGGLLALLARADWRIEVHCATYGEHGERHDGGLATPNALAETREQELEASCNVLGAEPPHFWGLPDGELHLHSGEQQRIARLLQQRAPDLILALGPDGAYGHPDHLALHRWVVEAWDQFGRPCPLLFPAFPPGLFIPQYEKCVASGIMGDPPAIGRADIGSAQAHYTVNIEPVRLIKRASVAAHRSQLPGGEPEAMFPAPIIESLLEQERYIDARGARVSAVATLLSTFVIAR